MGRGVGGGAYLLAVTHEWIVVVVAKGHVDVHTRLFHLLQTKTIISEGEEGEEREDIIPHSLPG